MTDIIARAKELLEDVTPGPWSVSYVDPDYPELQGAPQVENGIVRVPILLSDIYADFSPEDGDLVAEAWTHAKALAEETCEYAVQVSRGDDWVYTYETWDNRWQESYTVQEIRAQRDHPSEETRIVRRRVSPVEVVE